MRRKLYWGLGVFIVLFIIGAVFVFLDDRAENKQIEKELGEAQKLEAQNKAENTPQVKGISDVKPTDGPGFKEVRHGDHRDKIPNLNEPRLVGTDSSSDMSVLELKSDLPDKLPTEFPTDAEIQQMSIFDLNHLMNLYKKAADDLRKTDPAAATRLYNSTYIVLGLRMVKLADKENAELIARERERLKNLPLFYPATEESPAMILEIILPSDLEYEGSNQ